VFYSLTGVLKATGLDKVTILRAIEGGKIAAAKDLFDEWQIECESLHQVFPPVTERGSRSDAAQRCLAPSTATLEAQIGALREAGNRLRRQPGNARNAIQATGGSSREPASEIPPIEKIWIAVPAVGNHQIGTPLGDQRLRAVLTIGALLVALGLGWVGGFGSHHFSAPPPSFLRECEPAKHALDTEPSERAIGAEPHAAIRDRLQPQSVPAPWRSHRADRTAP